jgi:hypothetical protein
MVRTRSEMRRDVYVHLIQDILGFDLNHPIPLALKADGADSVPDIIAMTERNIEALRYEVTDSDGNVTEEKLNNGAQRLLTIIPSFLLHKRNQGTTLTEADWESVTAEEFQHYRASPDFIDMRTGRTAPTQPPPTATGNHPSTRPRDTVYDFKRGIKRDPGQFPVLKDDKQWDLWNIDTKAQARSQDVMEVLNPTYNPTTAEDIALLTRRRSSCLLSL